MEERMLDPRSVTDEVRAPESIAEPKVRHH
jgi:hypothetical protein